MRTFSEYAEQDESIESVVQGFIDDVRSLPDTDVDSDLFGEKNNRSSMLLFFKDVLNGIRYSKIKKRVLATNPQNMSAEQAFSLWNRAGHPVRDGLILLGNK